jgi:hypothetical protein
MAIGNPLKIPVGVQGVSYYKKPDGFLKFYYLGVRL